MLHTISVEEGKFVYGEFFTINVKNGKIEELPYILVGGDNGLNAMVSIGSTVYVVGGATREDGEKAATKPSKSRLDNKNTKQLLYHHGMSFIDLNSSETGWKSAPCYRGTPDYYSTSVSLDGKIYSFASSDSAGIFDPFTQEWESLLPPPEAGSFKIDCRTEVIADPDNKRLLVFFHDPIDGYFAYYPDDNRWERVANSLPWSAKHMLLADGGLFFIYVPKSRDVFKVYDSVAHQWLSVVFTSEVPYSVWRSKFQAMVYLGNGLICLLADFPILGADKNITKVSVCKFRFVRSPPDLIFTCFPIETYPLNSACQTIEAYLAI